MKIEFAKPGLSRPKGFSADHETLLEGHVLLEFERGWGRRFAALSEAGFTPNLGAAQRRPQPHKFEFGK